MLLSWLRLTLGLYPPHLSSTANGGLGLWGDGGDGMGSSGFNPPPIDWSQFFPPSYPVPTPTAADASSIPTQTPVYYGGDAGGSYGFGGDAGGSYNNFGGDAGASYPNFGGDAGASYNFGGDAGGSYNPAPPTVYSSTGGDGSFNNFGGDAGASYLNFGGDAGGSYVNNFGGDAGGDGWGRRRRGVVRGGARRQVGDAGGDGTWSGVNTGDADRPLWNIGDGNHEVEEDEDAPAQYFFGGDAGGSGRRRRGIRRQGGDGAGSWWNVGDGGYVAATTTATPTTTSIYTPDASTLAMWMQGDGSFIPVGDADSSSTATPTTTSIYTPDASTLAMWMQGDGSFIPAGDADSPVASSSYYYAPAPTDTPTADPYSPLVGVDQSFFQTFVQGRMQVRGTKVLTWPRMNGQQCNAKWEARQCSSSCPVDCVVCDRFVLYKSLSNGTKSLSKSLPQVGVAPLQRIVPRRLCDM